jgi:hypothetical protein
MCMERIGIAFAPLGVQPRATPWIGKLDSIPEQLKA